MVNIVSERSLVVTKANKGMYYEFRAGKPLDVEEEHLQFLPGWGTDRCEFKRLDEGTSEISEEKPRASKKKKNKEVE